MKTRVADRVLLDSMGRCERLGDDEVARLAAVVRDGSRPRAERDEARNRMAESVFPLLVSIAMKRANRNLADLDELISFGSLHLVDHILPAFDPGRGVKLSTYAGKSLEREFAKYAEEHMHPVHIPRYIATLVRRYQGIPAPAPLPRDWAATMGLSPAASEGFVAAIAIRGPRVPVAHHPGDPGHEVACPADPECREHARELVSIGVAALDRREAAIIRRHYGVYDWQRGCRYRPETLESIGRNHMSPPLCRERVRQIKDEALGKMREALCRMD